MSQSTSNPELNTLNLRLVQPLLSPALECALRLQRATLLTALGRPLDARLDHLRVLELDPTHRANLLQFGRLLVDSGNLPAAQILFAEAVRHFPQDVVARVNLAATLLQQNDPAAARPHYEIALRLSPELPEAHGGMYYTLSRLGEPAAAAIHQRKAFGPRHLFQLPFRGSGQPIPIVLLVSSTGGNTPIEKLLDDTVFQTSIVVADFFDPKTPLPPHHLLFNGIGDVEVAAPALRAAQTLLANSPSRILNPPAAVLATGRAHNAERLAAIPGVRTARTRTYPRAQLTAADAPATLARDGFTFPLLLRLPGFHMGQHFVQIDSPAAVSPELAALPRFGVPSDEILAIQYLDARGADGSHRKYRVLFIDGHAYPLHLAISAHWKIHYFSADMADRPDHRAEEAAFLADMPAVLGPRATHALHDIQQTLGLDYGGIDFGLNATGDLLLFEANATMVVEQPAPDPRWDYRRAAVTRIHNAVRRMLLHTAAPSLQPRIESAA